MAGALKKTMIYLGLADGDEQYEEEQRAAESRRHERADRAEHTDRNDHADRADHAEDWDEDSRPERPQPSRVAVAPVV